jgi:hypothetical protein
VKEIAAHHLDTAGRAQVPVGRAERTVLDDQAVLHDPAVDVHACAARVALAGIVRNDAVLDQPAVLENAAAVRVVPLRGPVADDETVGDGSACYVDAATLAAGAIAGHDAVGHQSGLHVNAAAVEGVGTPVGAFDG